MAFPNPNCEAGLEAIMREQRKAEARLLLADELSEKDAEIARLKAELSAARPSPKVEWTSKKGHLGNTEWYLDGIVYLWPRYRDDAVVWYSSEHLEPFPDLASAKAAVEATLMPAGVRRWVSRDRKNGFEQLVFVWKDKPELKDNGAWFVGNECTYLPDDLAAAIGIRLEPGECVLWDFTYRRIAERWEP